MSSVVSPSKWPELYSKKWSINNSSVIANKRFVDSLRVLHKSDCLTDVNIKQAHEFNKEIFSVLDEDPGGKSLPGSEQHSPYSDSRIVPTLKAQPYAYTVSAFNELSYGIFSLDKKDMSSNAKPTSYIPDKRSRLSLT